MLLRAIQHFDMFLADQLEFHIKVPVFLSLFFVSFEMKSRELSRRNFKSSFVVEGSSKNLESLTLETMKQQNNSLIYGLTQQPYWNWEE